jgi:O-antigen/teichoic acid export membrane protein
MNVEDTNASRLVTGGADLAHSLDGGPADKNGDPNERHFNTDHLRANLKNRTVSSGVVTLTAQGAKFFLTIASTVILARLLSPYDYGLLAMVATIMSLLRVFKDAGLSAATVQRDTITHAQVSNLFWINVALAGLLALIMATAAPAIAWFYHEPKLVGIALWLSLTFLISGSTVQHQALLQRQMRFKAIAVIQVGSMAVSLVVGVLMALWAGGGSSTFSLDDIKDLPGVIARLKMHSDPVSAFLWQNLSVQDQALLIHYQPSGPSSKQAQGVVVQALNKIITGPSIYEKERFKGIKLRPETVDLVKKTQTRPNLPLLNRGLLEDAYPKELSRRSGYWALVGMNLALEVSGFALTWWMSRWRPQRPRRESGTRSLLSFGINMTAGTAIYIFSRSVDTMLVGWRYGADATGLYSRALALLMRPMDQLLAPVSAVFVPTLSRLQDDPERYRRAFLQLYEAMALVSFGSAGLFFALSRPITVVLLGSKWAAAAVIFKGFAIGAPIAPIAASAVWILISQGRGQEYARMNLITAAITISSFVAGLPFGPVGVAFAFSIGGLVISMPVVYYLVGRRGPVRTRDLWAGFFRHLPLWAVVAGVTSLALARTAGFSPFIQLLICGPIGLAAGVGTILAIKPQREVATHLVKSIRGILLARRKAGTT